MNCTMQVNNYNYYNYDVVVEAHCYLSISGELIVSRYVAESITMIAGRFGHVGLCQLRTKLKNMCACKILRMHILYSVRHNRPCRQ